MIKFNGFQAIIYYHKALHLGCCSSPKSAFVYNSCQVHVLYCNFNMSLIHVIIVDPRVSVRRFFCKKVLSSILTGFQIGLCVCVLHTCEYQGVRNVSFLDNFPNELIKWPCSENWDWHWQKSQFFDRIVGKLFYLAWKLFQHRPKCFTWNV